MNQGSPEFNPRGIQAIAMMIGDKSLSLALLLALGMFLAPAYTNAQSMPKAAAQHAVAPTATQAQPALDPKAIEILKASSSRLAAARTMAFTAEVTYESPSRHGQPLAYTTKSDVILQRPDKLRVITLGDGPPSEF